MEAWWSTLAVPAQIFWVIACAGSCALLLLLIGSLTGMHHVEVGHSHPNVSGDPGGVHVLGVRTLTAFAVGFGWGGVISLAQHAPLWLAVLVALVAGGSLMGSIYTFMRWAMHLQADGSVDYHHAIGATAQVYLPIPGDGTPGQVEVLVQGRLAVVQAVSAGPACARGTAVKVVALRDPLTLVVAPVA